MWVRKERRYCTRERNIDSAVPAADGPLRTTQNNLKMNHKIEILTTPSCGNCEAVKRMLDEMKFPYETIDVTEKTGYLEKYPIFTVPGIVIDDKLEFVGIPKKQELMKKLF